MKRVVLAFAPIGLARHWKHFSARAIVFERSYFARGIGETQSRNQIVVRDAKGAKDRKTILPLSLIEPLKQHLLPVKALHQRDLRTGSSGLAFNRLIETP